MRTYYCRSALFLTHHSLYNLWSSPLITHGVNFIIIKQRETNMTYFPFAFCLRRWKTLMTSRMRRGLSSILAARNKEAIETCCHRNPIRNTDVRRIAVQDANLKIVIYERFGVVEPLENDLSCSHCNLNGNSSLMKRWSLHLESLPAVIEAKRLLPG